VPEPVTPSREPDPPPGEPTVAYTVGRVGWRRRTLRVQVRTDGAAPELVLVARAGTAPPGTAAEGHAVSRLAACALPATRTIEVPLDKAQLPWGVRLLPASGGVVMAHPPDGSLVIR
jgi:hypothetical protein